MAFLNDPGLLSILILGTGVISVLLTWILGIIHINKVCEREALQCTYDMHMQNIHAANTYVRNYMNNYASSTQATIAMRPIA